MQREDLNDAGYLVAYDDAGRLIEAAKTENPLALAANNTTPSAATVAALPDSRAHSWVTYLRAKGVPVIEYDKKLAPAFGSRAYLDRFLEKAEEQRKWVRATNTRQ